MSEKKSLGQINFEAYVRCNDEAWLSWDNASDCDKEACEVSAQAVVKAWLEENIDLVRLLEKAFLEAAMVYGGWEEDGLEFGVKPEAKAYARKKLEEIENGGRDYGGEK